MNPTNHWKLGLFVLGGTAIAFALLIWIGASNFDRTSVPAFSYFDESVQGLDTGSAVKYRGVTIGAVSRIGIAQDQQLVEVEFEVFAEDMRELGFGNVDRLIDEWGQGEFVPDNVRVSIASAGITGLKFLELDIFDPTTVKPPPELDFVPLWNYVPSTPSTIKGLEESIRQTADSIPELLADLEKLTESVTRVVDNPELRELVTSAHSLLDTANEKLGAIEARGLTEDLRTTLGTIDGTIADVRTSLTGTLDALRASVDDLSGDEGPVVALLERLDGVLDAVETELRAAQLGATTAALRSATADASGLMNDTRGLVSDTSVLEDDLSATLATLRETLDALSDLTRLLERNPSALLSGKSNP